MKKIILLGLITLLLSCSKDNCDAERQKITTDYQTALANAGGSATAMQEITRQYNAKISALKCN